MHPPTLPPEAEVETEAGAEAEAEVEAEVEAEAEVSFCHHPIHEKINIVPLIGSHLSFT